MVTRLGVENFVPLVFQHEVPMSELNARPASVVSFPPSNPDSAQSAGYQLDSSATSSLTGESVGRCGYIRVSSLPHVFRDVVTGRRPSPKSIYRWTRHGVRGQKLRTVNLPFGLATTIEWLEEFIASINHGRACPPRFVHSTTRRQRQLAAARTAANEILNAKDGGAK